MTRSSKFAMFSLGTLAAVCVISVLGCCNSLKPKPKKPFGETCELTTDCESLMCAEEGKICTKTCTYDADCGGEYVCRGDDTGTGSHCAKKQGTATSGQCMDPSECDHGHCLKRVGHDDDPGICSQHCKAAADCPAGFKTCLPISDSGAVSYCLPGEEKYGAAPPKAKTGGTATTKKTTADAAPPATAADAGKAAPTDAGTAAVDAGKAAAVDAGKPAAAVDAGRPPGIKDVKKK